LIILGAKLSDLEQVFERCTIAGHPSNRFNVLNEETRDHPDIFLCRNLRLPWDELWKLARAFG
jgi:hypothetical protein